jgi:hypothetical protein
VLVARWCEFEAELPEFAARAGERLGAHEQKTIATLRRNGSPRPAG